MYVRYTGIQDEHADLGTPDGQNHRMFGHQHPLAPPNPLLFDLWRHCGNFFLRHQVRASARGDLVKCNT